PLELVLDAAGPRLLSEIRVGALAQRPHVDLLAQQRETARVELREVENVADETLEPQRFLRDHLERPALRLLVVEDAFPESRNMTTDRRQRRPKLVRDRHEEVAGECLRLREPHGHVAEARGEPLDLATARSFRERDRVMTDGDLVRGR